MSLILSKHSKEIHSSLLEKFFNRGKSTDINYTNVITSIHLMEPLTTRQLCSEQLVELIQEMYSFVRKKKKGISLLCQNGEGVMQILKHFVREGIEKIELGGVLLEQLCLTDWMGMEDEFFYSLRMDFRFEDGEINGYSYKSGLIHMHPLEKIHSMDDLLRIRCIRYLFAAPDQVLHMLFGKSKEHLDFLRQKDESNYYRLLKVYRNSTMAKQKDIDMFLKTLSCITLLKILSFDSLNERITTACFQQLQTLLGIQDMKLQKEYMGSMANSMYRTLFQFISNQQAVLAENISFSKNSTSKFHIVLFPRVKKRSINTIHDLCCNLMVDHLHAWALSFKKIHNQSQDLIDFFIGTRGLFQYLLQNQDLITTKTELLEAIEIQLQGGPLKFMFADDERISLQHVHGNFDYDLDSFFQRDYLLPGSLEIQLENYSVSNPLNFQWYNDVLANMRQILIPDIFKGKPFFLYVFALRNHPIELSSNDYHHSEFAQSVSKTVLPIFASGGNYDSMIHNFSLQSFLRTFKGISYLLTKQKHKTIISIMRERCPKGTYHISKHGRIFFSNECWNALQKINHDGQNIAVIYIQRGFFHYQLNLHVSLCVEQCQANLRTFAAIEAIHDMMKQVNWIQNVSRTLKAIFHSKMIQNRIQRKQIHEILAARKIQRCWRKYQRLKFEMWLEYLLNSAALVIQDAWKHYLARKSFASIKKLPMQEGFEEMKDYQMLTISEKEPIETNKESIELHNPIEAQKESRERNKELTEAHKERTEAHKEPAPSLHGRSLNHLLVELGVSETILPHDLEQLKELAQQNEANIFHDNMKLLIPPNGYPFAISHKSEVNQMVVGSEKHLDMLFPDQPKWKSCMKESTKGKKKQKPCKPKIKGNKMKHEKKTLAESLMNLDFEKDVQTFLANEDYQVRFIPQPKSEHFNLNSKLGINTAKKVRKKKRKHSSWHDFMNTVSNLSKDF